MIVKFDIINITDICADDEFELLKKSGAKLPTDNYEFVTE